MYKFTRSSYIVLKIRDFSNGSFSIEVSSQTIEAKVLKNKQQTTVFFPFII